jgi:hypothetical protein
MMTDSTRRIGGVNRAGCAVNAPAPGSEGVASMRVESIAVGAAE